MVLAVAVGVADYCEVDYIVECRQIDWRNVELIRVAIKVFQPDHSGMDWYTHPSVAWSRTEIDIDRLLSAHDDSKKIVEMSNIK